MPEVYQGRRVIWESKARQYWRIGGCLLVIAIIVWMENNVWIAISLFSICGVFALYRVLSPRNLFVDPNSRQGREIRKELNNALLEQVTCDEGGLLIRENLELPPRHFAWRNLTAAFGYKIDVYTTDEICLDLFWVDAPRLTLSESMPQWLAVLAELQKQVPTVPPGWYADISVPAFETTLTLLFEKDGLSLPEAEKLYYNSKG